MASDMEQLYQQRFKRYTTAMRKGKPDMIPIRPFVAEFTAKYAGYTCQQVSHDYRIAFEAACKCAADFDWDAVVANMVYVWTGLTQAIGLKYYGIPGLHIPKDTGFQYREPPEDNAFMQADEYEALAADPVGFLYNVWLPRVSTEISPAGSPTSYRNNLSFVKGGMAMMSYFTAFGPQIQRLRQESGTVSAIAGIFKAPFDIIADKMRGYLGLTMDLFERPKQVLKACEALMPHLLHVALSGADPSKSVPIGFWMHRGCVPFINREQFSQLYWPTLKPVILEIIRQGWQVLFYAEGKWASHLDAFAELPDAGIVLHVDQDNIFEVHKKVGHKFCLSGGIPNFMLAYEKPAVVRDYCKRIIREVAFDGGYIADASAIMQNEASIENVRAMTETFREYGALKETTMMSEIKQPKIKPGVCIPWEEKRKELPNITGDEELFKRIWEDNEALAYMYIWQVLLSF